jgi:hypothetical protein
VSGLVWPRSYDAVNDTFYPSGNHKTRLVGRTTPTMTQCVVSKMPRRSRMEKYGTITHKRKTMQTRAVLIQQLLLYRGETKMPK